MILDDIVAAKHEAVAQRRQAVPLSQLKQQAKPSRRSLRQALRAGPTGLILECKQASPSAGQIRQNYEPAALAREYADVATAISVLTDEPFFCGHLDHLRAVAGSVKQPVLAKDFVVDPYQLYEARVYGADVVLLIAAILEDSMIAECLQVARSLALDVIVEVHDERELRRALALAAPIIGINNRNLKTFETSLLVSEELARQIPENVCVISESGIEDHQDLLRLRPRVHGFLVGTSLMNKANLALAARQLAYGRVKVCGLREREDAEAAWRAGASFGGMIFAPESPRLLSTGQALRLSRFSQLCWVGVFVNAAPQTIAKRVEDLGLSAVQLHGEESPELIETLRELLPAKCEIWSVVRVQGADLGRVDAPGDRLLLDRYDPTLRGGTGATFDWSEISKHPRRDRLIVSGGLKPENAARADRLGVWCLDVNSGVESSPGRKDPQRLGQFFSALRGQGRKD